MEYISALVLGLLGSFHCVGMCGPIALAIPVRNHSWPARLLGSFTYNFGRVITYAAMGAVFGLLGKGIALGGVQQWVSIGMGIIMILSVFFPLMFRNTKKLDGLLFTFVGGLKSKFRILFQKKTYPSLLLIGILNGFLPCGLVYIAIAGAIVSSEVYTGAIYMAIFGLGTIPVMLGLTVLGNMISVKFRNKIKRIIPVFIILIGILFILRGSNLGIPYLSPKFDAHKNTEMKCCHP
jgi:uncharacterized protein